MAVLPDEAATGLIDGRSVVNMLPELSVPSVDEIEYQDQ